MHLGNSFRVAEVTILSEPHRSEILVYVMFREQKTYNALFFFAQQCDSRFYLFVIPAALPI
jgi:hypothetical protein